MTCHMWSQFVIVISFGRTHVGALGMGGHHHQLNKVPLLQAKIGIIWSFPQNYHQLPEVPLVHPKIGIKWSFSQIYHQLPEVPLVQPKIGITWSSQNHYY